MTVIVETARLARALKFAAGITEARNTIPILSNVRITVLGGAMSLVTSDLDAELRQELEIVEGDGLAITVEARRLSQIASAFDQGSQTKLEMDDRRLVVKSGRSRFLLPTLPVDDFPTLPFDEAAPATEIAGGNLAAAIRAVEPSISREQTRYYLCGAFLDHEGDALRLVSTDGHRCTIAQTAAAWPRGADQAIVPAKYARILRELVEEAEAVTLAWAGNKVRATIGTTVLTGKTIDGTYPDYRRVLAQSVDKPARFDPDSMRTALRRVALVHDKTSKFLAFETGEAKITLTLSDPDGGNACEELPAECEAGHRAGFNWNYLSQALEAIGGETVEFHHADPGAPALLRRVPEGPVQVTLMPGRI